MSLIYIKKFRTSDYLAIISTIISLISLYYSSIYEKREVSGYVEGLLFSGPKINSDKKENVNDVVLDSEQQSYVQLNFFINNPTKYPVFIPLNRFSVYLAGNFEGLNASCEKPSKPILDLIQSDLKLDGDSIDNGKIVVVNANSSRMIEGSFSFKNAIGIVADSDLVMQEIVGDWPIAPQSAVDAYINHYKQASHVCLKFIMFAANVRERKYVKLGFISDGVIIKQDGRERNTISSPFSFGF